MRICVRTMSGGVHFGEAALESVNPVHSLYICPFSGYSFPEFVYIWHCCKTYSLLMKMSVNRFV